MKIAFVISFLIHFTCLMALYLNTSRVEILPINSIVEIQSEKKNEREQKERKKGSFLNKKKALNVNKSKNKIEGPGSDQDVVKAANMSGSHRSANVAFQYGMELQAYLERNRFYPRRAELLEQIGVVQVRFHVSSDGSFSKIKIVKGAPYKALNQAALDLIQSLKSFKPLPEKYKGNGEFFIPINYQLRRGGLNP